VGPQKLRCTTLVFLEVVEAGAYADGAGQERPRHLGFAIVPYLTFVAGQAVEKKWIYF
jgi:hypothetical protein